METKKTKLTISGKPKKNLYDKKGLTNNKNKQKFVTEKKFSRTTSKHINKWCNGISYKHSVPQDLIEGLISGVSARGKFVLNTKSSGE